MRKTALRAVATTACGVAASCGMTASAQALTWGPISTPVGSFAPSNSVDQCGPDSLGVAYYAPGNNSYTNPPCPGRYSPRSPTLVVGTSQSSPPGTFFLTTAAPLPAGSWGF